MSSDRLRAVVGTGERDLAASADAFAVLDLVVAARVRRRLTTVVDTLGLDPARRAAWRELAARHRVPCVAVAVDTPAAECRRRNAARPAGDRLPAKVLAGQLAAFAEQRPALDAEGFDAVLTAEPVRVVDPAVAVAVRERPRQAAEPRSAPVARPPVRPAPLDVARARAVPESSARGFGTSARPRRRRASTRCG